MNPNLQDRLRVYQLIGWMGPSLTPWMMVCHLRISLARVNVAIRWLIKQGYITSSLQVAPGSEAWFREQTQDVRGREDIRAWRDEVLTGLTENGEQSPIDRAVLPTKPEQRFLTMSAIERVFLQEIARELGLEMPEFIKKFGDGRIKWCRGYDRKKHLGVFHWRNKGKYTQTLCIECAKKVRKNK